MLTSVVYNDVANAMQSEDMLTRHGPASYGRELFTLGAMNGRIGALSSVPGYFPASATGTSVLPVPTAIGEGGIAAGGVPAAAAAAAATANLLGAGPLLGAPLAAAAAALPAPALPLPVLPPALGAASFVNDVPISIGPVSAHVIRPPDPPLPRKSWKSSEFQPSVTKVY